MVYGPQTLLRVTESFRMEIDTAHCSYKDQLHTCLISTPSRFIGALNSPVKDPNLERQQISPYHHINS